MKAAWRRVRWVGGNGQPESLEDLAELQAMSSH